MNIHRWRSHTRARTKDQRNAASQPRPTINSITPTCTAPLDARAGRLLVPACQHLPLYRRLRRASISAFILSLSSNNSRSRYVAVSAVGLKGAWGAGRGTPPVGPPGAPCDGLYGRCVIFALSCRNEEAHRVGIDGRCEAIQGPRTVSMIVMARRQARGATRLCGEAGSDDLKRAGRVARCAVGGTRLTDHGIFFWCPPHACSSLCRKCLIPRPAHDLQGSCHVLGDVACACVLRVGSAD